jgi:hypothetical protein
MVVPRVVDPVAVTRVALGKIAQCNRCRADKTFRVTDLAAWTNYLRICSR